MRKNELIKRLGKIPGNPNIVLAADEEGNDYYAMDGLYSDIHTFEEIGDAIVFWPSYRVALEEDPEDDEDEFDNEGTL